MMVQRGRKSAAALMVRPVVSNPIATAPPPAPQHLDEPERALWPLLLEDLDVESDTAFAVLTTALEAHATMRQCREAITEQGMITPEGRRTRCLNAARGARQNWLLCLRQLGFGKAPARKEKRYDRFGNPIPAGRAWEGFE